MAENNNCNTVKGRFFSRGWLRTNLNYLLMGIGIGLGIFFTISAYRGEWLSSKSLLFNVLFSTAISLSITNSIYVSQWLLRPKVRHPLVVVSTYYLASILGMLAGMELVYLLLSFIFNTPYTFFHKQDFIFSLIITIVICTTLYIRGAQKQKLLNSLKEKEMDVLRLTQVKTEAELATLQARINPHFLYNSLNAIASLIHTDPDKAESMTLKLSKLFRYSINHDKENLVSIQEEMEIVNTYIDIEKIRFGTRIDFVIDIAPELQHVKIPRFLIQPLIENSLKHGLNSVSANGLLKITIEQKDSIELAVSDNGTPFPEDYEIGYGLQSTYDKLALLYPGKYELQIRNQPVKEVRILIPRTDG